MGMLPLFYPLCSFFLSSVPFFFFFLCCAVLCCAVLLRYLFYYILDRWLVLTRAPRSIFTRPSSAFESPVGVFYGFILSIRLSSVVVLSSFHLKASLPALLIIFSFGACAWSHGHN